MGGRPARTIAFDPARSKAYHSCIGPRQAAETLLGAEVNLREYEAAKFELAEILRTIGEAASADGDLKSRVRELLARLAEDRFNLVVVGRFSRGKTTLMNAILGVDRLPTGILPLTSVITRVVYGSRERVRVEFERGAIGFEVPMEALADYITERGNPGNVRRIRAASIELPAEILRRGFCFVDTPGLGSAIAENTRTTEGFLPEADAVIMVSGYDGPLTQEELLAAGSLSRANRKLFFVLNKHDMAAPQARPEVENYVRARLAEVCGPDAPPIFSLSAREALAAKSSGNAAALAASGIDGLERALTRFLVDERSAQLLRSMCDRASQLLATLDGDPSPLRARLDGLAGLSQFRLSAPAAPAAGGHDVSRVAERSFRMEECAICARVADTLFDFMRQYQYDLVTRAEERERLASAGGLCAPHTWLYASLASDRDVCVALTPLAKRLATDLRAASSSPVQPGGARQSPYDAAPDCLLCAVEGEAQSRAVAELARTYETSASGESDSVPSVCLPHLRLVASQLGDRPLSRALERRQSMAAERLTEDMQRYVMKRDAIRGGLASDEETQAARRATSFIAGHRALAARDRAITPRDHPVAPRDHPLAPRGRSG